MKNRSEFKVRLNKIIAALLCLIGISGSIFKFIEFNSGQKFLQAFSVSPAAVVYIPSLINGKGLDAYADYFVGTEDSRGHIFWTALNWKVYESYPGNHRHVLSLFPQRLVGKKLIPQYFCSGSKLAKSLNWSQDIRAIWVKGLDLQYNVTGVSNSSYAISEIKFVCP